MRVEKSLRKKKEMDIDYADIWSDSWEFMKKRHFSNGNLRFEVTTRAINDKINDPVYKFNSKVWTAYIC